MSRRECRLALSPDQLRVRSTQLLLIRKLNSLCLSKYSKCLEERRTCGYIHFLLLVDLWLFHFLCIRNNYSTEGVCPKRLLATQGYAVFFCLSSIFSCIFFFLFSNLSIMGQQENTDTGRAPCQPVIYLDVPLVGTCHYCILTLGLQKAGMPPLLFICELVPSSLSGAWHITGVYQHLLDGGGHFCLIEGRRIWGPFEPNLIWA